MASHPEFDKQSIEHALDAAQRHARELTAQKGAVTHQSPLEDGALKVSAKCISVTVADGKVCLNLPFGIGNVCLPVPSWVPNGTAAQACLDICTKWGVPCGVEVTVSVAGQRVIQKHFGCSC